MENQSTALAIGLSFVVFTTTSPITIPDFASPSCIVYRSESKCKIKYFLNHPC